MSDVTEAPVETAQPPQDAAATSEDPVAAEQTTPVPTPAPTSTDGSLGKLADVTLDVTVELGRTKIPVRELLALDEGGVIRLEHPVGEPVNLLVNGLRTARGEIVVVDGRIGLRVTEVVE